MKTLLTTIALSLSLAAFAFNEGKPQGAEFHLEQNQEQLAQQQALQGRMDRVGDVPVDTEMQRRDPNKTPDATAQRTLALVQERENSRANIAKAEERMKAAEKAETRQANWPRYLIVLLVVVALMVIGKKYLDQSTPNMPKKRRVTW